MVKVSVILPNYNHERYLRKRIDSILNQTYSDFELLILDDCSSDNSRKIIEEYSLKDNRIKMLFNIENSGNTFIQWEKGIKKTTGKYIWIAESDDYSEPEFLNSLIKILDQKRNVGLAYTQSWEVNEYNVIIDSYKNWTKDLDDERWEKAFVNSGKDELKNYFCIKNTIPNASAVLIRREALEKAGKIETSMKLCGDKMFWTNLLLHSDIAFFPESLNYFRTHRNNVRTNSNSRITLIEDFKWFAYLRSHINIPSHNLRRVRNHHYKWWISLIVVNPFKIFSENNYIVLEEARRSDFLAFFRIFLYLFNYYISRVKSRVNKREIYA